MALRVMEFTPETADIHAYVVSTGVPFRVTSAKRPPRFAGDRSYHIQGLALDLAGPQPSRNSPELLAIFRSFAPVEHLLAELIYSGAPYSIKNGKRVARYAVDGHWDHVHVAVPKGRFLLPLHPSSPKPQEAPAVSDPNIHPTYAEVVNLVATPSGQGYWIICADGSVYAFGDAPYLGRVEVKK